jgi:hypothetical protein
MEQWLTRNRKSGYILINVAVLIAVVAGCGVSDAPLGLAMYVSALFALCSMPILWLERLNDRYSLLAMFMALYFILFGALDLQALVTGVDPPVVREGSFTAAQIAVLLGALCTVVGYLAVARVISPGSDAVPTDWSNFMVLLVGLGCWVGGSLAVCYYSLYLVTENSVSATAKGLTAMGPLLTFAVMLGQMMQPLGVVILAYGYAKTRSTLWLGLVVAVVILQLALGFVTDTKGTALFGFLLVAVTVTLWEGKVSKVWVLGVVVFAVVMFPIFQANRVARNERGMNRQQALENIWKIVQESFEAREKIYETQGGHRAQTFLERSSGEPALELLFQHVGVDTPFLHGATLVALPYTFIPRLLVPDKEDVQVGQLYNQTFLHGSKDDFTYISVSQLGELYWNYGWPGVVFGSLLTGALLGLLGAKSSLSEAHSLTRLLILLVTVKSLCLGYGGSISMTYVVWMRSMAAVGLLHLALSRPIRAAQQGPRRNLSRPPGASSVTLPTLPSPSRSGRLGPEPVQGVRFPNLMR